MNAVTLHSRAGNMQSSHTLPTLLLAWFFLPLATTIAAVCFAYSRVQWILSQRPRPYEDKSGRKILITGSSPEAIALANALHASGNHVIGADYARFPLIPSARFSSAFASYHNLYEQRKGKGADEKKVFKGLGVRVEISVPFAWLWTPHRISHLAQDVIALIECEKPDLWIPCNSSQSGLTADDIPKAVEAVRRRALCAVLHADEDTTEMLTDESGFAEYVEQLETGVKVPEFKTVTTRDEIHRILAAIPESRWELEYHGPTSGSETACEDEDLRVDGVDKRRWTWPPPKQRSINSDSGDESQPPSPHLRSTSKIILPLRSRNATYHAIAGLLISPEHPWTMRESVSGQTITCHLLVVQNRLRSIVAVLPQPQGNDHVATQAELIPPASLLHKPFQSFAEAFTSSLPEDTTSFISINFVVVGTATTMGTINTIYPTSCSVGVQATAPALMMDSPHHSNAVVRAIVDAATPRTRQGKRSASDSRAAIHLATSERTSSHNKRGVYSFYPALLTLVVLPLLKWLTGSGEVADFTGGVLSFSEKLLLWGNALFSVRDPLPWWWECYVRLPLLYASERFTNRHD